MLSDDVWVIAPDHDQSGVTHSLSLNDPLRLRQVAERRLAVRGTPTDCVIMGTHHLLSGKWSLDAVLILLIPGEFPVSAATGSRTGSRTSS